MYIVAFISITQTSSIKTKYFLKLFVYICIIVEKDSVRTDCHINYFSNEDGNENVKALKRVLSAFVLYDPQLGTYMYACTCNIQFHNHCMLMWLWLLFKIIMMSGQHTGNGAWGAM